MFVYVIKIMTNMQVQDYGKRERTEKKKRIQEKIINPEQILSSFKKKI